MTDAWRRGFGPGVVSRLLPQRAPFLMVDVVDRFSWDEPRGLEAHRLISQNEPVFAGHFPGLPLWPGALTIEGLGQSMQLLAALVFLRAEAEASAIAPDALHRALVALDARNHLRPAHVEPAIAEFLARIGESKTPIGVASRVNVRFLEPVFAGQKLDYDVRLERESMGVLVYAVRASVDSVVVADGTMSGSINRIAR